ncbi:protein-disulfide reductase DsbD family protein [Parabacteroides sp. FAFU027]|uniref:protein-disulfide reductase DsbD family protein n=1 Tax=Parabacteroides sp. FAFU027 TaxID=2922715 RepID=UPI001FAF3ACA|nr:thioredoxin family protein [Parabacteroides sp. FAFU027]
MKKLFGLLVLLFVFCFHGTSQIQDPVHWSYKVNDTGKDTKEILFTAKLDNGWHLYGLDLPEGGPVATQFTFEKVEGGKLDGKVRPDSKLITHFDKQFEMNLSWYEQSATFTQKVIVTNPDKFSISGYVKYMACNDQSCLPPTDFNFTIGNTKAKAATPEKKTEHVQVVDTPKVAAMALPAKSPSDSGTVDLWKPVVEQLHAYGNKGITENTSVWLIFLYGFLGGLLALMTPCVWPMIPMTVSFFLKHSQNRKKAISGAITYGVAIIVIYLSLGLIITGLFGASALNDLSTNAIFNLLFFALLVVFAISFLGAFEIILPSSWTNKVDSEVDKTTGLLSIFFMAFTLSLVSFSCTGPIIGTLLVQAATMGNYFGPAVGMFGFALALAIPFALFALFPSWLQRMPKSGGWLNTVKVILGFLELALAFKFFSVADLAYGWHLLDRETFLVIWIVIFALLGIYLLGKLKLPHDSEVPHVSVPRLFMAIVSFSFAVYMIPGLWGAPLKSISAFAPPLSTQDFNLYKNEVHAKFDDYEAGMTYAKANNKPVMIDFSGFGCVNCRKMEAAVWIDPKVKQILENDYVLITLFVDDKRPLPEPITVNENGTERKLRTIGDKWSYLQRVRFEANAQPFYVLLNGKGEPIGPSYAYDEDVNRFVLFLENGLAEFRKKSK